MLLLRKVMGELAARAGTAEMRARASKVRIDDLGHGYDVFGLNRDFVAMADAILDPLYRSYFRVRSVGSEHIPSSGPAILAANHGGTLPFDGMLLWLDVLRHTDPPRVLRIIADYFVPWMPVVGPLFARFGVVTGTRGNLGALLERGELAAIFPEGVTGIGKPWARRYQLQEWRHGHAEFAIRYRAPVIPVALVGGEDQMPQLGRIELRGPLPYLPIPATPLPLPVQYHVLYGEPIRFDAAPADADDPQVVQEAAERVRDAVDALIRRGLQLRRTS